MLAVLVELHEIVILDSQNFELTLEELREVMEIERKMFIDSYVLKLQKFLEEKGMGKFKVLEAEVSIKLASSNFGVFKNPS
jgi:hypothetical protein